MMHILLEALLNPTLRGQSPLLENPILANNKRGPQAPSKVIMDEMGDTQVPYNQDYPKISWVMFANQL